MARPVSGYTTITDPAAPLVEWDTVTCCHCGALIRIKPGTAATVFVIFDAVAWRWVEEPGASCFCCLKPVCLACHALGRCLPLERQLAQLEARR